jgi:hypothetical protein
MVLRGRCTIFFFGLDSFGNDCHTKTQSNSHLEQVLSHGRCVLRRNLTAFSYNTEFQKTHKQERNVSHLLTDIARKRVVWKSATFVVITGAQAVQTII